MKKSSSSNLSHQADRKNSSKQTTKSKNFTTESWFTPKNILTMFQTLAILGAAIWTLFVFFRFENEERTLSNIILKSQNLQSELTNKLIQLQKEKTKIELDQIKSSQFIFNQEIEVTDIGPTNRDNKHTFLVQYNYTITNIGKLKKEVSCIIINSFFTSLPVSLDTLAIEIPALNDENYEIWNLIFCKGYYYGPKWKKGLMTTYKGNKIIFNKGGGGTSELDSGEKSKGSIDLVVHAKQYDIVGFELIIHFNEGASPDDRWQLTKTAYLHSGHLPIQ